MSRILFKIIFCLFSFVALAQTNNIAIGQWRVHLPFSKTTLVTDAGDKVYAAGVSGMFSYSKSDNAVTVLSKVQGLSDVTITTLRYNPSRNILLIGYENGNIDLLSGSDVFNIPDIKRKQISARKAVNNVFFKDQFAYLACGFGIVVVDLEKKEIKDSYLIGQNGGYLNIYDISSDGASLFAGTENGVYSASLTTENLANFQEWSRQTIISSAISSGHFNAVHFFNGHLYANYSKFSQTGQSDRDTVYRWDGASWTRTNYGGHYPLNYIRSRGSALLFVTKNVTYITRIDSTGDYINFYFDQYASINDADISDDGKIYVADNNNGLVKRNDPGSFMRLSPGGPASINVADIGTRGNEIWIAPGGKDLMWTQQYNTEGISVLRDNSWLVLRNQITDAAPDLLSIAVNPTNIDQVFSGTWGSGIVEFNPEGAVKTYFTQGTKLQIQQLVTNYDVVRVGDTKYDGDGNLWMTNWYVSQPLIVFTKEGVWEAFDFTSVNIDKPEVAKILVTSNNQIWIQTRSTGAGGILVYDHNGTITDKSDDKAQHLSTSIGQGALPSNEILSFTQDKDGAIWVGTDKGIAVFYNPENIFSGENFDGQSVLINQDGHTQKLLETEAVTSIVIDGANRKWFGTQNSGIYLMSADGTKQLEHFTAEESPLLSNTIIAMAVSPESGELFVATEKGLISYKGTSTEGKTRCEDTYAYPNPVRPGYSGLIAVKGLVTDAHVRITDISGNLVYETKGIGGQAVWDGRNHRGERVQSGVYIVFASNDDGSETCVTKILFIN